MTTPPGQEPRPGPTRGGPVRPAPRGADPGWPGSGDPRRGVPGRGPGGPPRDGADPGRAGYGAPGAAGPVRGNGRPEPDPRRQGRGGLGPGGTEAVPRGAGAPRGAPPTGPDDFGARRRAPGRGPAAPADPPPGLRPGPTLRRLGTLRARTAVFILVGATLLGMAGTVATHREPGALLQFFVILGAVVAALGIQRRKLHLLIPLPALALFIGAVAIGAFHDRKVDTSLTEMGVNFLQWIASVFFAMCAVTIIVLVIASARWLLSRQLVSGQFPMSADRAGPARGPRPVPGQRPDAPVKPGSRADGGRPDGDGRGAARPPRDPRDNRTPWDNRGTVADRDPRTGGRDDRWGADNRRGDPSQRGDRPSFIPLGQSDPREPRNDRPRPTY